MEKSSRAPVETVSAGLYLELLGLVFGYRGETKHWTVAAIQNLVVIPLIRVISAFLND
jgi:hypothetical protein